MTARLRKFIIANVASLALVLIVNYLANALPLNGHTSAELSDFYPNLFVPAGITFTIWGIIYTWLIVWVGVQVAAFFRPDLLDRVQVIVQRIGWWFPITCLLNVAWLLAWHWELVAVSLVVMLLLLSSLVIINLRIGMGDQSTSRADYWLVHVPFGIYQGWITVATVANVTALLVGSGLGAVLNEILWAYIVITSAVILSAWMLYQYRNLTHALAVIWALLGIWIKQKTGVETVAGVAMFMLILLSMVTAWQAWRMYNGCAYRDQEEEGRKDKPRRIAGLF
jgi:translocator protein